MKGIGVGGICVISPPQKKSTTKKRTMQVCACFQPKQEARV
jgi:hypothetical protein